MGINHWSSPASFFPRVRNQLMRSDTTVEMADLETNLVESKEIAVGEEKPKKRHKRDMTYFSQDDIDELMDTMRETRAEEKLQQDDIGSQIVKITNDMNELREQQHQGFEKINSQIEVLTRVELFIV